MNEQIARYERQAHDAKTYQTLWSNQEFQEFKKREYDAVLVNFIGAVMNADTTNEHDVKEALRNINKYQGLVKFMNDSFANAIDAGTEARAYLNNQRKPKEFS